MKPARLLIPLLLSQTLAWSGEISFPSDIPQAAFAGQRLIDATRSTGESRDLVMKIDDSLPEQAYRIEADDDSLTISGADPNGLMYGGLELAERLHLGLEPGADPINGEPFIKRRGLKMNIPLDGRCPSYDDSGSSARMNIAQVWSEEFWHGFLDQMAEHRYNTLTLWSNHPFSAMLELEDYPEVALHDVALPTYELDDQMLPQYKQQELQDPSNYRVIKKMPMSEKVAFWQHVMRYAKERGIDIYFITWNIWVHGAEGKYGITASQTNPKTLAYIRECVKQFVLTYPDLKGIGITCGEHMQNDLEGENSVERWMWNSYGKGILDAKAEQPEREVHFIHRIWYSGMDAMIDDFISKYPDPIAVGYKYAKARLYSIPNPPFFNKELAPALDKHQLSCWMNLRNDDIFNFRWGDPDYVRSYIRNLPPEPRLAAFHMGSDGYVWGREFTSKDPDSPRQLEIDKHWYRFMMWGRLGYNPALEPSFFKAKLAKRFPKADADELYDTWQTASKIVPLINTWHWRDWDHMWSVETCMSKKDGYHSVDAFIEFWPLPGQGMQSIDAFVRRPNGQTQSPLEVADQLDHLAAGTLRGANALQDPAAGKELRQTLADLEAFAHLAGYYADKIRGSTSLHRFRVEGQAEDQKQATRHLEAAVAHWKEYGAVAASQYEVQLLARTSDTDWNGRLLQLAEDDLRIIREARHGEFPPSVIGSSLPKK